MHLVRWESGSYRFDPNTRWPNAPLIKLGLEASLLEASRRGDEQKRFVSVFKDPHRQIAVHDVPDPNQPLSDAERDLFGIIDGAAHRRGDRAARAAQRVRGLRDAAPHAGGEVDRARSGAATRARARRRRRARRSCAPARSGRCCGSWWCWSGVVGSCSRSGSGGLQLAAVPPPNPANDVFAAAQIRNLRDRRSSSTAGERGVSRPHRGHGSGPLDHGGSGARERLRPALTAPPRGSGDCRIALAPDR
jgi:hypothetical protein